MASQMSDAKYETKSVKIDSDKYRFTSASSKVVFAGYLTVYQTDEDKIDKKALSKKIEKGMELGLEEVDKSSTLPSHRHTLRRHHLLKRWKNLV